MIQKKKLWELFCSILYLSTFTFGGGFVIVTLMKKKFVDEKHWIEEEEMLDLTAIAQSCPGSIAINASILVGFKIGKIPGSLVAILGTVIPPITILTIISSFYEAFSSNVWIAGLLKGMQAGVAAVIMDVVLSMGSNVVRDKNVLSILIMVVTFILVFFVKINIIYVILVCIAIGLLKAARMNRRVNG